MAISASVKRVVQRVVYARSFLLHTGMTISALALVAAVVTLGDIASLLTSFLLSMSSLMQFVKSRSTEGDDVVSDLHVLKLMSCVVWGIYGILHVFRFPVINGMIRVLLGLSTVITYLYFASQNEKRQMILELYVALSLSALLVVAWCIAIRISKHSQHDYQRQVLGAFCAVTSILIQFATLYRSLWQLKVETRQQYTCRLIICSFAAAFVEGAVGTIDGFWTRDFYMMIPDALAALVGAAQFFFWVWWYKTHHY